MININDLDVGVLKEIVFRISELDPTLLNLAVAQINQNSLDLQLSNANKEITKLKTQLGLEAESADSPKKEEGDKDAISD